jgi:hypothetical protein
MFWFFRYFVSVQRPIRFLGAVGLRGRPRVRLLGCNGHTWPLMQYKPGGLTQPLPVVVTTGPGIHQAQSPEG